MILPRQANLPKANRNRRFHGCLVTGDNPNTKTRAKKLPPYVSIRDAPLAIIKLHLDRAGPKALSHVFNCARLRRELL